MRDVKSSRTMIEPLEERRLLAAQLFANLAPAGLYPGELTPLNDELIFAAGATGGEGEESEGGLWISNGTANGTHPLKSFQQLSSLVRSGNYVYFVGDGGLLERGLWRTDGTADGTTFLKSFDFDNYDEPTDLTDFNGTLMFSSDGTLWKSDGTSDGTVIVRQEDPDSPRGPDKLTVVGNWLYFFGDGWTNAGLWRTDGTAQGTTPYFGMTAPTNGDFVKDIGGQLYVLQNGSDGAHDGLWKSDPTQGMTELFSFDPGAGGLLGVGNNAWFVEHSWNDNEDSLWWTDGTIDHLVYSATSLTGLAYVGGKVLVDAGDEKDRLLAIDPGDGSATQLADFTNRLPDEVTSINVGSEAVFQVKYLGGPTYLWGSDGTVAGTVKVAKIQFRIEDAAYMDGKLYFAAPDSMGDDELWASDLNPGGTRMVMDVTGGSADYTVSNLVTIGNTLYFATSMESGGDRLFFWKTDGVHPPTLFKAFIDDWQHVYANLFSVGTTLVAAISDNQFGIYGYATTDSDLWAVNAAGNLAKIAGIMTNVNVFSQTPARTYFTAKGQGGADDTQLWVTDGTTKGTVRLYSNNVRTYGTATTLSDPVLFQGRLYFILDPSDIHQGSQLWSTDGTKAQTRRVTTMSNKITDPPNAFLDIGLLGKKLYVSTFDGSGTGQLWVTDGTKAGTLVIANTVGRGMTVVGKMLYFWSDRVAATPVLYKTDGTRQGTVRVRQFPANSYELRSITAVGGRIYFYVAGFDYALDYYMSDGTAAGTVKLDWPVDATLSSVGAEIYLTDTDRYIYRGDRGHYRRIIKLPPDTLAGEIVKLGDHYFFSLITDTGSNLSGGLWDFQL